MAIKLNKFDPHILNEKRKSYGPATCVFLGRRGAGKSTLVSDILYHVRKIPCSMVISGTEDGNSFYSRHVPDLFIHSEFSPILVKQFVERQKCLISKFDANADGETKMKADAILLLDDLMYDSKAVVNDKTVRSIFMNGRWYRIMCMMTAQYCMDIPPGLRGNVDYLFILKENIVESQKKLYKHFFGMFPTFDMFRSVLMQCTENYECIVLDNTSKSNKIEDCVFWYKAIPNREFKVGSKGLWEYHFQNYDKNKSAGPKSLPEKGKTVGINVKKSGKKITKDAKKK